MQATEPFEVGFGTIAWTIRYTDPQGVLVFTFEAAGGKALTLNRGGLIDRGPTKLEKAAGPRVDLAFERVKQYLDGIGYQVSIYG